MARVAPSSLQPVKREQADGRRETAAPVVGMRAHRLELADAVRVVEPGEAVGDEGSVRRLDDAVEVGAVRPGGLHVDEALDRDPRRRPDDPMQLDPRLQVGGLDGAQPVAVRQRPGQASSPSSRR